MVAGLCRPEPGGSAGPPDRCANIDRRADSQDACMSEGRPADVPTLRKLSPLDGMKKDNLAALARKVAIRELPANRTLFKEGDNDAAGLLADRRAGRAARGRPHRGDDPRRHPGGAQSAVAEAAAARDGARGRHHRVPRRRQRPARHDDHLGPDRHLRGRRAAGALRRRRRRRLDDDTAADQGLPPHPAGQHPGDLHAHAARALPRRRGHHPPGRPTATISTPSSAASARSRARRRSTARASGSRSCRSATPSARRR